MKPTLITIAIIIIAAVMNMFNELLGFRIRRLTTAPTAHGPLSKPSENPQKKAE